MGSVTQTGRLHPKRQHRPLGHLARRIITVAAGYVNDVAHRWPKALSPRDIPTARSQVTRQWLAAVLCAATPGADVKHFHTRAVSAGTATRWAVTVTYNEVGTQASLPMELFAKTTEGFRQRLLLGLAGVLAGEPKFYASFRPKLNIEAPQGYYGAFDERSCRSIALMENVAATKGATFPSPVDAVSRTDIEQVLDSFATMHGRYWDAGELRVPELRDSLEVIARADSLIGMRKRSMVGEKRAAAVIPAELKGRAGEVFDAALQSLRLDQSMVPTLVHGDGHVGQTYRTADGRMGLTDFQVVQRGRWAYDVAYTINSALAVPDRRAWDRELLAFYLDRLSKAGGDAPDFDDAWLEYRRHAFYPYVAWVFGMGRAAFQPRFQPDEYSSAIIERTGNAIVDLDAFAALEDGVQ